MSIDVVAGPVGTAAAGANNGTTPPVPVVSAGSADVRGNITFGSGGTPAAGAQVVVTNASNVLSVTPYVFLTAKNAATQALGLFATSVSASGFTISTANAPTASQANTVYSVDYLIVE